ncbi:MAG: N-acetyltransferase family protein [Candidatus Electrothrix sp. YB6]
MKIRRAAAADLPALVNLLDVLFSIEEDFAADAARQEQGLQLLLDNSRTAVLVAEQEGQVVGMCTGQLLISTAEGGLSALVEDVVLLPEWRGQGIGRQLMKAIADWATEQGATRVQLLADRNNSSALAFYNRLGYRVTELICLRRVDGGK